MPYFRHLVDCEGNGQNSSLGNETDALRLFETYLLRLETYAKDREEWNLLYPIVRVALKFRTEQKILIESHLKCVRLRLKLLLRVMILPCLNF